MFCKIFSATAVKWGMKEKRKKILMVAVFHYYCTP